MERPGNIDLFIWLLSDAQRFYPNLAIVTDIWGIPFLKGVLDIPNDNGEIVGHFLVEIYCSARFPFKFPIMHETGGDIPQDANWHKNRDGSCCITVWPDELKKCKHGITITEYIRDYAVPYFANQIYRAQVGHYRNGEYAHNRPGIFQYYFELQKNELILK
jgi:hypothetical protein